MSHFSVIVITETRPTEEDLARILQPWHEYECTGVDDEYVVNVDDTEKLRTQWQTETTRRYRDPQGDLHNPYEDRFYRDPTPDESQKIGPIAGTGFGHGISWSSKSWGDGRGYRAKVHFLPEGWEEVDTPRADVQSFREFISDYTNRDEVLAGGGGKYGFTEVSDLGPDGEVIRTVDRTNPNKKWDGWVIGGRWSGHLRVKPGVTAIKGRKGLLGSCSSDDANAADQATMAEIDLDGMRQTARIEFGERWDRVHSAAGHLELPASFETIREQCGQDTEAARTAYWSQPAVKALRDAFPDNWGIEEELRALTMDRDAYCEAGAAGALSSFAVVKDGQWYERGTMGWWGVVIDEKDKSTWNQQFNALLDALPPEACLTVVDCHI